MAKRIPKYDRTCMSFQNFEDAINRPATFRTYSYTMDELVRFAKFTGYDELTQLDTEQIHELLTQWIRDSKQKKLSYKTIKLKLNAVELFFDMNKKILYKKILHKMLPSNDELPSGDRPFTTEELWKMKQKAVKPRDIAVIDFLASTGIRPGSLIDPVLRIKHTQEMPDGCMAVRVYDGSREGYWAFLTPEATQSLRHYLQSRKRNGEEIIDESVLFRTYDNPNKKNDWLEANSIRQMLTTMMKHAGIERQKIKNRYDKAVVYGFRKRFNTILKLNNAVNSNIAEKLMAHKRGLDGTYLQPTHEECFSEFKKAIRDLTIDPTLRQEIKIKKLEQETNQNKFLEERVKQLESKLATFKDIESDYKQMTAEALDKLDTDELCKLMILNIQSAHRKKPVPENFL